MTSSKIRTLITSSSLLGTLALAATVGQAADWPRFRGPDGSATLAEPAKLPTVWGDEQNVVWKTALPGAGASSPIVVGSRIYLTAYTGFGLSETEPGNPADLRLHLLCFDRATGNKVWDTEFASPVERKAGGRVGDHGLATPTPVADESGVYAFFGPSGLFAFDLEGKERWRADCGTKVAGFGHAASPILFQNLVIQNASIESDTLYAFDKATGKQVWKAENINRAWTTPALASLPDGKVELIVNQKDEVRGYDPATGEKLWWCVGIDDYIVPCPVVHEGIAYCIGGRTNRALAIRCGGRGDVTASHKVWEVRIGANVTSPILHDGHLYWASDRGQMYCLDAKTGESVYRERLPTGDRVYASIVLGDGKFYAPLRDGRVLVIKADPTFAILAENVFATDRKPFNASPALHNGQILLRTDAFLYCVGE